MTTNSLTLRERAFVTEYLKDRNAKQAYIRTGYKARGNSAEVNGARLLRKAQVAAEVTRLESEFIASAQKEKGITLEKSVREIAKGAFYDVRNLFNADGSPKDIQDLDDITAAAIEGIEVIENYVGTGEDKVFTGYTKKYRLSPRSKSLDMLMKHLNGYKEHEAAPANALMELLGGMKRSALPVVHEVEHDSSL